MSNIKRKESDLIGNILADGNLDIQFAYVFANITH